MLPAIIVLAVFILPWIVIAWMRIYYLARFFQLEGYDFKRYLRWVINNSGEIKQFVIVLIIFVLYMLISIGANLTTYTGEIIFLAAITNVFAYGFLIRFAPKNRDIK